MRLAGGTLWQSTKVSERGRVLLTGGSARYAEALVARGMEVIAASVTTIAAPEDGGLALALAVAHLREDDWVLLTSANAAHRFADAGPSPVGRIVCVGGATADAALGRGLRVEPVGAEAHGAAAARALLAAAGPRPRVLFPRAVDGRDEAVEILRAGGAVVELVWAYRTRTASRTQADVAAALAALAGGELDVVAFFAPSQVAALVELVGPLGRAALGATARVAIGATTAQALAAAGLAAVAVAAAPEPAALVAAVALARASRRDTT